MGAPSGVGSYVDNLISSRVIAVILSRYVERVYSVECPDGYQITVVTFLTRAFPPILVDTETTREKAFFLRRQKRCYKTFLTSELTSIWIASLCVA